MVTSVPGRYHSDQVSSPPGCGRELSGAAPLLCPPVCEARDVLVGALAAARPRRVVVGCRASSTRRGELLARLGEAGAAAGGVEIVDLQTADGCTAEVALEQSVALLTAAVARVGAADIEAPVQERTSLSVGGVSRRSLLRGVNTARRFVAVWRPERCASGVGCTSCALACPREALSRTACRVVVDGGRCNGCGVCVASCRRGAFALPGADVDGLSAAAAVLVAAIRRHRSATGVAIACRRASVVPRVGEPWLVLRVPSVEMVTAGWLLQLIRAGVGVRLIGCEDERCGERVVDLEHFVHRLASALGFSDVVDPGPLAPRVPPREGDWIELWEPEATMQSLAAFGALGPGETSWRVEGPGCPLGVVRIDSAGCSLCEVCVGVCPTGALKAERNSAGSVRLSFDSGRCTACAACVGSCPESVVTLERAADGGVLVQGRQVVATGPPVGCVRCGAPLAARPLPGALRRRLAGSHPTLGAETASICADCRLGGRSVAAGSRRVK